MWVLPRRSFSGLLFFLVANPFSVFAVSTPTTIFTLPGPAQPASWFENLAVRPNGLILATRGDAPEIWQIDPATGEGSLLVSVEGTFNLTGIAQVIPREEKRNKGANQQQQPHSNDDAGETYVFGSSHIPAPLQVEPGSAKVWTLHFPPTTAGTTNHNNDSPSPSPTVSLLAALPSAGFINGIAAWDAGRVLLSDTEAEAVYLMDAATGTLSTAMTDLPGINGIQTAVTTGKDISSSSSRYVYVADHLERTLRRIPANVADATATGPAEVLAADLPSIDDFAVVVTGGTTTAYVAGMYENVIVEVVSRTNGTTTTTTTTTTTRVVANDVSGTGTGLVTAVVFGRRPEDAGLLYATVGQAGGSASIVVLDPNE